MDLFGYLRWREACRLAAQTMHGQCADGDIASRLWSLCVFFETYLHEGSEGTVEDFGPKEPVKLELVRKEISP